RKARCRGGVDWRKSAVALGWPAASTYRCCKREPSHARVGEALRASFPRSGGVAATVAAIAYVAITRSGHSRCVGCGIEPPNDEIAGQEVRYPRLCRRREPDELNW